MNTIVKINSNEGGTFTAQNNHLSFDIPAGNYFDMSTAYINLVMSCPILTQAMGNTSTAAGQNAAGIALDATSVYIPQIQFNDTGGVDDTTKYENSALLRSVKMDCELRGSIEDIQRCDILTHNLNQYSKSAFQQTSHLYERLCSEFAISRTKGSIFNEIHKEGTVPSRNLNRVPVRIKLSDVMNFCKTTQFNTGKYGKTRIHCELNLDRLNTPRQYLGDAVTAGQGGNTDTDVRPRGGGSSNNDDWKIENDPVFIPNRRTADEESLEGAAGAQGARLSANSQFAGASSNAVCMMMHPDNTADDGATGDSATILSATCNRPNAIAGVSTTFKSFYIAADPNPYVPAAPFGGTAAGALAASAIKGGKFPRIFNRLEECPYYVGQKVRVSCNSFGANAVARGVIAATQLNPYIRQIVAIDYNRGDGAGSAPQNSAAQGGVNVPGAICITLNAALPGTISGTAKYVDVVMTGATCQFDDVRCDFAELVLEQLAPGNIVAEPDTISYSTFKTEEIDTGGTENFQHQFMGHPNAMNMYIMQPSNQTNGSIKSSQGLLDSYRIRVNNKDTSSRQIFLRDSGTAATLDSQKTRGITNDPLHTHKQQSALVNSDRVVKNLHEQPMNVFENDGVLRERFPRGFNTRNGGSEDALLIGQVLPLTQQPKTIQVNLQARNQGNSAAQVAARGIKNLVVYQEIMQEI